MKTRSQDRSTNVEEEDQDMKDNLKKRSTNEVSLSSLQAAAAKSPSEMPVARTPDGKPLREVDIARMVDECAAMLKKDPEDVADKILEGLEEGHDAQAFVDQFFSYMTEMQQSRAEEDHLEDGWEDDIEDDMERLLDA